MGIFAGFLTFSSLRAASSAPRKSGKSTSIFCQNAGKHQKGLFRHLLRNPTLKAVWGKGLLGFYLALASCLSLSRPL